MSFVRICAAAVFLLGVSVVGLVAQEPGSGVALGNLRAYRHVFIAYAVGWVLILGWIVSIARRLGRIESRLPPSD